MSKDQLAVITGASSGFGKEYAKQLASLGYNLFLTARRENLLQDLKENLEGKYNISVDYMTADLSDDNDLKTLCSHVSNLEHVTFLVNSAGFANIGKFLDVNWERHNRMIKVQSVAPTQLAYSVLPTMMKQNRGTIINVSSMAGLTKGRGIYGATKAYLNDFSLYLSKYLKEYNIKVQAFCAGYTYTGFHKTEEYKKHRVDAYKAIPSFVWMDVDVAVSKSLKSLKKRKTVYVPGIKNKILLTLYKLGLISAKSTAQRSSKKL